MHGAGKHLAAPHSLLSEEPPMSRYRLWGTVFVVSALGFALAALGCGSDTKSGATASRPTATSGSPTSSTAAAAEATAIEVKDTGTLKGKVTYDGPPPTPKDLTSAMEAKAEPDKSHCLKGDRKEEVWMVGADKGVANVIVWLRAPEGKFFDVPAAERNRTETVTMDQPFCQFIPHVQAINPSDYDPATKKQKKTGQTLKILNSAPINHNTAWKGNPLLNPGVNQIINPKKEMDVVAKPCGDSRFGGEDLLSVNCDIHKWMTAKVAVFDHPYYAVTKADGTYEIKNAPAGVEVILCHWHESMDENSLKKAQTEKYTLKAGDNTKDFMIKAKEQ
jgi:hypothetical protein